MKFLLPLNRLSKQPGRWTYVGKALQRNPKWVLPALFLSLTCNSHLFAQYSTIAVTGYNADVVAEGTGATIALTNNDVDAAGYNFMSVGYTNPSNQTTTRGLPLNGLITSAVTTTPGLTYQLASYNVNNSLRINGTGNGILSFATPTAAEKVYVLATSGSGISTATITVTFTDNSTQVFTQTVADWYGGANAAIIGVGRVNRNTNGIDNNTTNPRLYQYELSLTAGNFTNPIQSITFANTGFVLNVMGISIKTPPANCAGAPTAGTSPASLTTCPGNTVSISAIGATFASGISHQWQQSTDNGATWQNAIGGTVANITSYTTPVITSVNSGIQYKLVTTCSFSGLSSTSNITTVTNSSFLDCYCASNATNSADTELLNVSFGSLNNSSTCSTTGGTGSTLNRYSNYKSTVPAPSVMQGDVVPFSVQVGTCSGNYNKGVKVYIDYNQNGLLTDAGEEALFLLAPSITPQTLSGNITIPFSALPGNTLMRVVLRESGTAANIAPCGTYTYGETEDYLVNITVAQPCTGMPSAGSVAITSPASLQHCGNGSFTLAVTGNTTGFSGLTNQWQSSTDGVTFTDIAGANSASYTTPVLTASGTAPVYTYYQFKVTCANSGLSEESVPEVAMVNPVPVISASVTSPTLCTGSSTAISATSNLTGTSFSWSPTTGLSSTFGNSVTATPTATTLYSVTGTTAAGCSNLATAGVMVSSQFFNNQLANSYATVGNAVAQANNFYQLTAAANDQTGAVWNNMPITLTSSFDFTFTVNQCGGADGMGFVLQNNGTTAIGAGGGSMSYYGTHGYFAQSLAVMQKIYQTSQLIVTKNKNAASLSTTTITPTLTNCLDRTLRITWDPATTEFKVYFDNVLRYTLTENIINTVFGGNSQVYFGFTGATGGVNAVQKVKPETLIYTPTYTVNKNAASNLFNFTSLQNLAQVLNCTNIGNPVTVNVTPGSGPYNEQLLLGPISGVSATNTVTINGNGETITACGTTTANRDIVRLDGSDWVRLMNFNIQATCSQGWGVHLLNGADNNVISGNTVTVNATSTNLSWNQGIVAVNSLVDPQVFGAAATNLTIKNNTVNGGYNGIRINGAQATPSTGLVLDSNRVNNAYEYGIYVLYNNAPVITENKVNMRAGNPRSTGIMINRIEDGITFTANQIVNSGRRSVFVNYVNSASTTVGLIANNMVAGGLQNQAEADGLYINYSNYLNIYHNSTVTDNTGTGYSFAVTNWGSRYLDVRNNSFAYTGGGTGYATAIGAGIMNFQADYNNYYSNGTKFARMGNADRATLAALKTAPNISGSHDTNSANVNPLHVSNLDLHLQPASALITNSLLLVSVMPNVTTDFDGQVRQPMTSIGADGIIALPRVAPPTVLESDVYPNPFKDELFVKLSGKGNVQLSLTDMVGRQVYSVNATAVTRELKVKPDVQLGQGVYILKVSCNGVVSQTKVIKQ